MKSTTARLNLILTMTVITALTAACSSGSLPTNMDTQSSAASVAAPPLDVFVSSEAILVGGTSTLTVTGGTPPYRLTLSNPAFGSLSQTTLLLAGNVTFTGAAAGAENVTVTDQNNLPVVKSVSVSAVVASAPVVASTTKALYLYYMNYGFMSGQSTWTNGVYTKLTDSSTAPAGYTAKGIGLYVYVNQLSGTQPLNQCLDSTGQTFETLAANCENQAFSKVLGYVYPSTSTSVAGTTALIRYKLQSTDTYISGDDDDSDDSGPPMTSPGARVDHVTTIYPAQADIHVAEGTIGYAPNALVQ